MKKSNLNRLEYFVAIAEAGTITAAADRLRVSKAVVSRQLQLLEQDLETTLILRNSRHLHLTEAGQAFYEAAQASVAQAREAFDLLRRGQDAPSGNLRITAPLDLGSDYVVPVITEFRELCPAVTVDLTLSDARFDPVEARFDIAFRAGWLNDSANVARKLADFSQIVLASPIFIDRHGLPQEPGDLVSLPFIEHKALQNPLRWEFVDREGRSERVDLEPQISADVTPAIRELAEAGAGIAILPDFYARRSIEQGQLVRLLPDWQLPAGGIYAVFPPTPYRSAATRRFVDLFTQRLREKLA